MRPQLSRKNNSGSGLLEFAVAAIVVGLLVAVLLDRVNEYRAEADEAAAREFAGILRTALNGRLNAARAVHPDASLAGLATQNPMAWVDHPPPNYLGEYYSPDLKQLPKGNWFYDRTDHSLVYLLNNAKSFADGQPKILKFKVKSSRLPEGPAGSIPVAGGAVLEEIAVTN